MNDPVQILNFFFLATQRHVMQVINIEEGMANPHSDVTDKTYLEEKDIKARERLAFLLIALSIYSRFGRCVRPSTLKTNKKKRGAMDHSRPRRH